MLGEHGEVSHDLTCRSRRRAEVPLILAGPGVPRGGARTVSCARPASLRRCWRSPAYRRATS
ncbi:MAG: hypothetical protein R2862_12745 [Thermoanaerobaculia bacterium]